MKNSLLALFAGVLFGSGLAISGMTDRNKVLGFLDITGAWDPTLLWVMLSALAVGIPSFYFILKRNKPLFDSRFFLPISSAVDLRLLLGATIFGIGWGLYGYCPGPAIASLVYLNSETVVFVLMMVVGLFVPRIWQGLRG